VWAYALGADHFRGKGIELLLVPSCSRCNGWLGDKAYHTIRQRKGYIASRLRELSNRVLAAPAWSVEELEELGYVLRTLIQSKEDVRLYLTRRIDWAETTFKWDEV
jgi:hypothetical protein